MWRSWIGTAHDRIDRDPASEVIASWGAVHLDFLRKHLPYEHGVPGERWLTILMNRIDPELFAAAFAGWVREGWPRRPISWRSMGVSRAGHH